MNTLDAARRVFEKNKGLAFKIANSAYARLPRRIERTDIENSALLGLWKSARKHHALPANEFYAVAVVRIRGEIADFLRSTDWLPRLVRAGPGKGFRQVPIDDIETSGEHNFTIDIEAAIDLLRQSRSLRESLTVLNNRQRVIVERVLAGEKQREIGDDLGFSEGRISQILSESAALIRKQLGLK